MTDFRQLIDAARTENAASGIAVRAGKKYTTVAVRVELLRRHLGAYGIQTEILQWATESGKPIVVKAIITDDTGRIVATGHAEEIRGKGNINSTSALENAETSAIGRALAALGIHGGEFASANEMEGVTRKADAITPTQLQHGEAIKDAWRAAVEDSLPDNATPQQKAEAYAEAICKEFAGKGEKALQNAWSRHSKIIEGLEARFPALHERIVDAYENRMMEIHEGAAA